MANPTITDISQDGSVVLVKWTLTSADATGVAVPWVQWADRTVLFYGGATWGAATAAFEGSNDGTNFIALADGQGGAISKTTDSVESIVELTQFARPRLTTVGTAASIAVSLVMRRQQPIRV